MIGNAMMRFAAGEIADDGALMIRAIIESDIALRTHPGLAAVGPGKYKIGPGLPGKISFPPVCFSRLVGLV